MCGTEPRYDEILVITNTIRKPKRKIYLDITNKYQHVTKDECGTDQQRWKSFNPVTREQRLSQKLIIYTDTGTIETSTDPLYPLCPLLVQIRKCWVVQRNTVTKQLLTIPRHNEQFGCFSANSLKRGFRYNEPSI